MYQYLKFSLRNIWRNIGLSFMTVVFIALAVYMMATMIILYRMTHYGLQGLEQGVVLTVILQPNVSLDKANPLLEEFQNTPGISKVEYQSAEEVKEKFKNNYSDSSISDILYVLNSNPFSAQVVISSDNYQSLNIWLEKFRNGAYADIVYRQNLADFQESLNEMEQQISQPIRYAGYVVAIIFAIITSILMFNTIRITIFTQREEIGIMKLVGATNWFVRIPYLLQTIWLVLIGSFLAYLVLYFVGSVMNPMVQQVFNWPNYRITDELTIRFFQNFGQAGGLLLVVSLIATVASLRRHLKV